MKPQYSHIFLDLQYLPPVQWFALANSFQTVYLEAYEHYIKGSYRNRCHIASAQGVQRLSIPLQKGKNAQKPITEVEISHITNWQVQHWQSIQTSYGKAPFFEYYVDDIKPLFMSKKENLWDWNFQLLEVMVDLIGIEVTFEKTITYNKETGEDSLDYRGGVHPNVLKQKKDIDFVPKKYGQVFEEKHGFLPNLSILDTLMCKGPETILLI